MSKNAGDSMKEIEAKSEEIGKKDKRVRRKSRDLGSARPQSGGAWHVARLAPAVLRLCSAPLAPVRP